MSFAIAVAYWALLAALAGGLCWRRLSLVCLRRTLLLTGLAFVLALISMPVLRSALPDEAGLIWLVCVVLLVFGLTAISTAAAIVGLFRLGRGVFAFVVVLNVLVVALFVVNASTDWLWPYRRY